MLWDEVEEGEDLFDAIDSLEVESAEEESAVESIIADEVTEVESNKDKDKEEEEEENLFEIVEKEEEEEEEDEEGNDPHNSKDTSGSKVSMVNYLKGKGILKFELEEGQELNEDLAEELIEDSFEEATEALVEEKLKGLPEEFQAAIKFGLKGGSLQDFYDTMSEVYEGAGEVLTESMDLSDDDTLERIARVILADDYDSEDDLEAHIALLRDRGTLKSYATKHYNSWLKEKKETEKELIELQAKNKKNEEINLKTRKVELNSVLEKEELGVKPSKSDMKDLGSYLYDKTVKLSNGGTITEFQKKILIDMSGNPKALAQLGILTRNLNEDGTINFEALDLKSESKIVRGIRDGIDPNKGKSTRQRTVTQRKSLADIISPK